jgi:hypothetical protein
VVRRPSPKKPVNPQPPKKPSNSYLTLTVALTRVHFFFVL